MNQNIIKELKNPKTKEEIKKSIEIIIFCEDVPRALRFYKYLEKIVKKYPEIEKAEPEFFKDIQEAIIKMKIIAISSLNESEVLNLIEQNFNIFLEMPTLDITERFKKFIVFRFLDFNERDIFKKKIINSLRNSDIKLVARSFTNEKGEMIASSIKNWLTDYDRKFGFTQVDKLKQIEYLEKRTANFLLPEKEKLRTFFNFYEYLKTPSSTMEGLEETFLFSPGGKTLKIYREGRLETIDPKIVRMVEEVLSKFPKSKEKLEKKQTGSSKEIEKKSATTSVRPPSLEQKYLEEEKNSSIVRQ